MQKFIRIWKAKRATPFPVIQGTVGNLLVCLALEIIQGKHAVFPLAESWIVCFFFYQQSQGSSPRLCKKRDSGLCIGPAEGFHVILEEGAQGFGFLTCDLFSLEVSAQEPERAVWPPATSHKDGAVLQFSTTKTCLHQAYICFTPSDHPCGSELHPVN